MSNWLYIFWSKVSLWWRFLKNKIKQKPKPSTPKYILEIPDRVGGKQGVKLVDIDESEGIVHAKPRTRTLLLLGLFCKNREREELKWVSLTGKRNLWTAVRPPCVGQDARESDSTLGQWQQRRESYWKSAKTSWFRRWLRELGVFSFWFYWKKFFQDNRSARSLYLTMFNK